MSSSELKIIPLTEYPGARRPLESKSRASWTRDAKMGKIPGAFRFTPGGDWFVDLEAHDAAVRALSAAPAVFVSDKTDTEDAAIALADRLGLSFDDVKIALEAAGG